jgi:hypothetical protein
MGHSRHADPPQPPQPPQIERRIELPAPQVVGVAILFLIPLAALLGVFDRSSRDEHAEVAGLEVHLTYPERMRYHQSGSIEVTIRNTSAYRSDSMRVTFDPAYLERFASVTFAPSADEAYSVALPGLDPGRERRVRVDLEADRGGRQRGWVQVEAGPTGHAELPLRTFVFP